MALYKFTLAAAYLDVTGESFREATVTIESIPSEFADQDDNVILLGPTKVQLSGGADLSVQLDTDSTSGNSAKLGYKVTTRALLADGTIKTTKPLEFWARPSGAVLNLADLTVSENAYVNPNMTGELQAAIADKMDKGSLVFHVDDYPSIHAAVAAAKPVKGTVFLPPGTFEITTPVVLPAHVRLVGSGPKATTIKVANGSNINAIVSEDYAVLTGTDKWQVNEGVPVGFSIEHLRIDGNKAYNSSGHGIRLYAKRYRIYDVVVADCPDTGLYSECAYKGGQSETDDMPEADIDQFYVRNCNSHGIQYRGPHDGHFGSVYTALNGGHGFLSEVSVNLYNGQSDIDFIHSYANVLDGVRLNATTAISQLQSESNDERGVTLNAENTRIGTLYCFKNWEALGLGAGVPAGNASVAITSTRVTVGAARIRCDYGGTGLKVSATNAVVGAVSVDGHGSAGVGIDVQSNYVSIGAGTVERFTATGGIGFQLGNNMSQVMARVTCSDNKTGVNYVGTGNRHHLSFAGYVNSGQVGVAGTLTGDNNVVVESFGGVGTGLSRNVTVAGSSWNAGHPILGTHHLWVDSSGRLRIKNGSPTSDTDGIVVGTQT